MALCTMSTLPDLKENRIDDAKPYNAKPLNPAASLRSPPPTPFTSIMNATTPVEPPVDTTSHLCNSQYLIVPLETLLDDAHDFPPTMHDIAEAYNVFSVRLRNERNALQRQGAKYAALEAVRARATDLAHLLHVHLRLALNKELAHLSKYDLGTSLPIEGGRLAEDDISHAEDSILVCHSAMRVVSDIMAFWRLHQLFSIDNLCLLLADLCDIVLEKKLYIVKARQTYTLALWILYAQNLPWDVLATQKERLSTILERAIRGEVGLTVTVSDGCRAFHKLSKLHASLLLPQLEPLVPAILPYLRSSSPERRLYAAHALAGFAQGRLSCGLPLSGACAALHSFINTESPSANGDTLQDILSIAYKQQAPVHCGDGPIFATIVALAIVVLSGPDVFKHPPTVKLVLSVAASAGTHGRSSARKLGGRIWRALAWAASGTDAGTTKERTRDKLWRVVTQDLRHGAGAAQVAGLLATGILADVARAVHVVERMQVHAEEEVRGEAREVLQRMLGVGEGTMPPRIDSLVDASLLDGDALFTPYNKLSVLGSRLKPLDINVVRPLTEEEILSQWDKLLDCWTHAAHAASPSDSNLLAAWQSLLLAQSHLTQGLAHLTAPPAHAKAVALRLAGFVDASKSADAQVAQLASIGALWGVVRNVYAAPWLAGVAYGVLDAVCGADYNLSDGEVRAAFVRCVAQVVWPGSRTLVQHVFETLRVEATLGRAIWAELVPRYKQEGSQEASVPLEVEWQDAAYLLSLPLRGWHMDEDECGHWCYILRHATLIPGAKGTQSVSVVASAFDHIALADDIWIANLLFSPQIIILLLGYVDLSVELDVPKGLFGALDLLLLRLYPPTSDTLSTCAAILARMATIVRSASPELTVAVLAAVDGGLCCWLENVGEGMNDEQYNEHVIPIYAAALDNLARTPTLAEHLQSPADRLQSSAERLRSLSRLLSSVFYAPFPGDGPLYFEDFWRATYHGDARFYPFITERLGNCLAALDQCQGGSLAQGISQSQSQNMMSSDGPSGDDAYFNADLASAFRVGSSETGSPSTPRRSQRRRAQTGSADRRAQYGFTDLRAQTGSTERRQVIVEERRSNHARKRQASEDLVPRTPDRSGPSTPKRRRFDVVVEVKSESTGSALKRRALVFDGVEAPTPTPTQPGKTPTSTPPKKKQRTAGRMILDAVEVPTLAEVRRRQGEERRGQDKVRQRHAELERAHPACLADSQEDYDDWERGVSPQDFGDEEVLPSDEEELAEVTRARSCMPPPTLPVSRPNFNDRTQTEPTMAHAQQQAMPSLRRAATDESARLAALKRAHTAVMSSESQTPVEDLMEAQQMAIQIQAELNQQLLKRLARAKR